MITGTLTHKLESATGEGQKGTWVKQPFVIKQEGQYGKEVAFLAWGDQAATIQSLPIGATLTVSYKPESREYNNRWYTDLRVTDISTADKIANTNESMRSVTPNPTMDDTSDLPF